MSEYHCIDCAPGEIHTTSSTHPFRAAKPDAPTIPAPWIPDIRIRRNPLCAYVDGLSDQGVELVDAYLPGGAAPLEVLDAGRIVLDLDAADELVREAQRRSLRVDDDGVAR